MWCPPQGSPAFASGPGCCSLIPASHTYLTTQEPQAPCAPSIFPQMKLWRPVSTSACFRPLRIWSRDEQASQGTCNTPCSWPSVISTGSQLECFITTSLPLFTSTHILTNSREARKAAQSRVSLVLPSLPSISLLEPARLKEQDLSVSGPKPHGP